MKFAYDANDMSAAVAYANKVKAQYIRGNKEIAHAMWKRDPNAAQGLDFEGFKVAMKKFTTSTDSCKLISYQPEQSNYYDHLHSNVFHELPSFRTDCFGRCFEIGS